MQARTKKAHPQPSETVAAHATILPGVELCEISTHGVVHTAVLLLPGNLFSVAWNSGEFSPAAALALGRVLLAHSSDPANPGDLGDEFQALEKLGRNKPRPHWVDLPEVQMTPAYASGRLTCLGLRARSDVATLFLMTKAPIPMGWVHFSGTTIESPLLVALGRLITMHATNRHN